jgi:hypothetical protein
VFQQRALKKCETNKETYNGELFVCAVGTNVYKLILPLLIAKYSGIDGDLKSRKTGRFPNSFFLPIVTVTSSGTVVHQTEKTASRLDAYTSIHGYIVQ